MPQLNGSGHTIVADGTDIAEAFGMVLSRFSEQLPEPKVTKVDIPAGVDLDITEALGVIGYHNGTHTLELYLVADSEAERVRLTRELVAMLHGQAMDYRLSWDDAYTYHGRFQIGVERLSPKSSRITVGIDRSPWKKGRTRETHVIDCHPYGWLDLTKSTRYHDVRAKFLQSGGADVAVEEPTTLTTRATGTHALAADVNGDSTAWLRVDDWLLYVDDDGDCVVKDSKFSVSNGNAVIDASYTVSDGDICFADADKQKVTVDFYRWDV